MTKIVLVTALLAFNSLLLAGCDYYKTYTGYLVVRSEPFIHHYVGNPCGVDEIKYPPIETCDKEEIRYTFVHRNIKIIAHCQAWDRSIDGSGNRRQNCGALRVGEAYRCSHSGDLLSCGDRATHDDAALGIEIAEKN